MPKRPTSPPLIASSLRPCWTNAARGILIVAGLPLALGFAAVAPVGSPPSAAWPTLAVDPNLAPAPVLEALPGLGPALAGRIIAARPLRSLTDLDRRVKGIGPAKVAALRPLLRFAEPAGSP